MDAWFSSRWLVEVVFVSREVHKVDNENKKIHFPNMPSHIYTFKGVLLLNTYLFMLKSNCMSTKSKVVIFSLLSKRVTTHFRKLLNCKHCLHGAIMLVLPHPSVYNGEFLLQFCLFGLRTRKYFGSMVILYLLLAV